MNRDKQKHFPGPSPKEVVERNDEVLSAQDKLDLGQLMRQDWGRRLYYRLVFLMCGLDDEGFHTNGSIMSHIQGRRSIGALLKAEAQSNCPDLWVRMISEKAAETADRLRAEREAVERQQANQNQRIAR